MNTLIANLIDYFCYYSNESLCIFNRKSQIIAFAGGRNMQAEIVEPKGHSNEAVVI